MYEDFVAVDRWTSEPQHCVWKATVVAIATRHADATDIRFAVNDRPIWIALPNTAWIEQTSPPRSPAATSSRPSSPATTTAARSTP